MGNAQAQLKAEISRHELEADTKMKVAQVLPNETRNTSTIDSILYYDISQDKHKYGF